MAGARDPSPEFAAAGPVDFSSGLHHPFIRVGHLSQPMKVK
jgi:hypothetical protein